MNWAALALTLIGLYFNCKKSVWCWPIWVVSDMLWIAYLLPKNEVAQVLMNIVFIGFNAYGWALWMQKR
jgi:nicotinamide riboside transporter PnuC